MTVYPDLAFCLGLTVHGAVTFISLTLLDLRRPWWQILTHIFGSALLSALTLFPRIHTLILLLGGLLLSAFLYRGKNFKGKVLNFLTGI
ncbi:MAG: hypothetical protein J6B54_01945, partial [Clostridia bacterium]|nr:hypothetical protein [Clostridia bacterium]